MFNADAYRAALAPWEFRHNGRVFVARHVSAPQVQQYEAVIHAGADERRGRRALHVLLRHAFPWRPSYLKHGDPVRVILSQLDPATQREALVDFFACLQGASRLLPRPTTRGPGSSNRIPLRSS